MIPFGRVLKLGSRGEDCVAVKRALARAEHGDLYAKGTKALLFGPFAVQNLKAFQKSKKLKADGVYGEETHKKLVPYFDAYSESLYKVPDKALATCWEMIEFGRLFHSRYLYGGEHDSTVTDDHPWYLFDCSSSVSFMLWHSGLFRAGPAIVSGMFSSYGEPGPGKYITIFENSDHVWIRFTPPGQYFRFDTSPHGDGDHGPRIRTGRRSEVGFNARHPKGY